MSSEWLDVVRWNAKLFGGMQYYHFARELNTQAKYGEALSALTQATNSTAEAVNACAGANPLLRVQFERAHATCHEAQTKAKKDNDLLYYEKVCPDRAQSCGRRRALHCRACALGCRAARWAARCPSRMVGCALLRWRRTPSRAS